MLAEIYMLWMEAAARAAKEAATNLVCRRNLSGGTIVKFPAGDFCM